MGSEESAPRCTWFTPTLTCILMLGVPMTCVGLLFQTSCCKAESGHISSSGVAPCDGHQVDSPQMQKVSSTGDDGKCQGENSRDLMTDARQNEDVIPTNLVR